MNQVREYQIQNATVEDAEALLAIYAPYVEHTAVSFEYEVPTIEEFRSRVEHISAKYPYLKAVTPNGEILGYAYAAEFKWRKAYDYSVETTIYLREDVKRGGIGRALYAALEEGLRSMGILNMNACIALPKEESPRLTMDSIHFHEKLGFSLVGTFHDSGYKFDTWYDMIWMEKMLGAHTAKHAPVAFGAYRRQI